MQAFIAFAARKFGSLLAFDVEIEQNKRKRSFAEIFVAMNVFSQRLKHNLQWETEKKRNFAAELFDKLKT